MSTASVHPFSRQLLAAVAAGSIVLSGLFGLATPASADEVPVEEVTTQVVEAPAEDVAVEDAPAEEAPVEEVPVEEVPVEEVPVEEAPAEEAPVEEGAEEQAAVQAEPSELAAVTPALTVSQTTEFDLAATTPITVSGSGFTTTGNVGTRPPVAGVPAGVYVVVGKFPTTWKPSEGVGTAARTVISQKWAVPGTTPPLLVGNPQYVPMNADGSFTVTLDVKTSTAEGNYGIYTFPAGGSTNAAEELYVPISFAAPVVVPAVPTISASQTTGFAPDATTPITVSGTGFTTTGNVGTRPPVAGVPAGVYVVVGKFPTTWKPSEGVGSAARTVISQKWAVPGTTPPMLVGNAQYVPMNADGSFTVTLDVKTSTAEGNYGVYTFPGGGATNTAEELYVPISFAAPTPKITVSKTTDFDPAATTPITVTGSAFTTTGNVGTRPPVAGVPAGVYVVVGKFPTTWKPSEGVGTAARTVISQKWAVPGTTPPMLVGNAQYVPMNADGSFTLTLDVKMSTAEGNYGVYTYPGGGATNAAEELYVPITFAAPVPKITASKTTDFALDATTPITVSGTGFTTTGNVGTRPPVAGVPAGVYVVVGKFPTTWKPSEGVGTAARTVISQKWAVPGTTPPMLVGNAQYVPMNADGTFTVTLDVKTSTAEGNYGIYTFPGGGATNTAEELYVPITFAAPAPTPTLTVSKTSGLNPAGEEITVTATNYNADAINLHGAPNPAAKAGFYLQVGYIDSAWRPSEGAASSARSNAYSEWFANTINTSAPGKWTENADGTVNATWTITVTKTALDAVARTGAQLAVFTVGAGGVIQAVNEKSVAIEFAAPAAAPSITVSKTSGFDAAATTPITVSGSGFTTTGNVGTRPPVAGVPAGVYVVVGKFPTVWKPSENVPTAARTIIDQKWVVPGATPPLLVGNVQYVPMAPDGTFTVTLDVKTSMAEGNYGVYTFPGGGAKNAAEELYVPISFAAPVVSTTTTLSASPASFTQGASTRLTATVAPGAAGTITFYAGSSALGAAQAVTPGVPTVSLDYTPTAAGSVSLSARFVPADSAAFAASTGTAQVSVAAPAVAAGSLMWGIKASFRDYVTGTIAKGSITTSGVGTSGGAFVFGQAAGGSFDGTTGTSNYSGSVTFTGHNGTLNLVISNPVIRIDSATSGALLINGSSFATLNLAAGSRSANGGAVTWSSVPATLTAAGAGLFEGFYGAGTALDPLTFTIGSPSSAGGGTAQVVSAYSGGRTPAETPPAAEGLTVVGTGPIVAGADITVTGEGFQPNETDILVVIYSTPQVLSRTVTADANGVATWTGRLPKDLTGTHTLTLQGSVSRGIVLEIEAPKTTQVVGCPVEGATLTWGFKETFRSYISGSIANGEWIVANGATYETPVFGWENGAGGYDSETGEGLVSFTGSIQFTGHSGALDTTVANPQIEFVDADTAMVLVDVTGVTQSGETVNALGVEFVELDISGAEILDGVLTITDAPAVLTEAGATAFGTYPAGEPFDAVTLSVPLADCADEAVAAPDAEEQEGEVEVTSAEAPNLWWILWVALGLAVAAIIVALVVAARRRARSAE